MTSRLKRKHSPENRPNSGAALAIVEAGKSTRFQPGICPNPGGRPAFAELSAAYRSELGETIDPRIARRLRVPIGSTNAEAIAIVVVRNALRGSVAAVRELANRSEGLPAAFLAMATLNKNPEDVPSRDDYVRCVREALGFRDNPTANVRQEVTFIVKEDPPKYRLPPTEQKLMDDLLAVIRTTPDDAIAKQIAELARTLRKKYAAAKP